MPRPLTEYNRKRDFQKTREPQGQTAQGERADAGSLSFVIQKHAARRLHYDFRLELDGTLVSWAVPKGPSLDPKDKRLAVHVEDHPLSYGSFEGSIPKGQYGGGDVIVWDQGIWQPEGDPSKAYRDGKMKFTLIGEKLTGNWTLVRTRLPGSGDKEQWLLIKEKDHAARDADEFDVLRERPESVISGSVIDEKTGRTMAVDQPAEPKATKAAAKSAAKAKKNKASAKAGSERFPEMLGPQLATLASQPPAGDWRYEIKFDGYRLMVRIDAKGKVNIFTRNGHDWSHKLPEQCRELAALKLKNSWLDGELVVLNEDGMPDFQALQNAFDTERSQRMLLYLFDAPFLKGEDLRRQPLEARRAALEQMLSGQTGELLRFSHTFEADYVSIFKSACDMSLEGIIGKRAGSLYVSRRSADWIKLKCKQRQEFVIIGFTAPKGSRTGFGSLLLGVNAKDDDRLVYAGRVGTGFNQARISAIHKQLKAIRQDRQPVKGTVPDARTVTWVKPQLVCEVEFAEWTGANIIRQPVFISLRTDKPAREVVREEPVAPEQVEKVMGSKRVSGKVAGVRISNAQRVIDQLSGATKGDLAAFYESIADWAVPHLAGRPVSLLRAPEGVEGEQFFQKHAERLAIPNIRHLDPALDPEHGSYMEVNNVRALIGAVQMGTIEFHTWGSSSNNIDKPDRITLDLDPGEGLPWRSMIEATELVLAVLDELGLESWLKTSGGKGMHIVIPLARHADWDTAKAFSKAISSFVTRQLPDRFTDKMGPRNRVGKIFIDYLRNQHGASTVAAYSVRARPGLAVSVPIARDELQELRSAAQWHIGNLHERLEQLAEDPWSGYRNRQRIKQSYWEQLNAKAP
ncbi:ATP-dependent DNA ligase LigD phosphoesterase module /ATP-dependent DNA ligase LigD polymerase module [Halopseudomonas litoralis]|uniref:DNA ligase (ATP) n=1 Tax=Halopseudomonas litoralis TaxID=797277 RepID=A0A1H1T8T5_9GAMM|nr:DNA ligase D [Halopseudomonas litoralis]SDS56675.1 ATP-dependent DNA ligase LigD phosphoesterase module /ATP-dependent DNA ligase LigD polymerase module [Halopseudomonas litoralis]